MYDNSGYRFRGHQLTNARGQYALFTVVPGLYPRADEARPREVQAPREPVLTTQLFFPGVAGNRTDSIYDPDCVVGLWRLANGRRLATFDFVLDV